MMNHQDQQMPSMNLKSGTGVALFVARVGAVTVEVFLRGRFGSRYLGVQAAIALVLIPVFGMLWPDQDQQPLFVFMGAYLFMCVVAQAGIARRALRGDLEHTRYNGLPRLAWMFGVAERPVKRVVEPLLVLFVGAAINDNNVPLGHYLMFAAACLFITATMDDNWESWRVDSMHDAVMEQQGIARRFRTM
jgi:hypothetical protein